MKTLTREELEILRCTSIGGSDAPVIKRVSPFATPIELWARKKKLIPPQKVTYRMRRGLRLEPDARKKYEEETGIPMPPLVVRHPEIGYMHASFDGLNFDARGAIEIKSPGKKDHITALQGYVPRKYIWQCVHNLFVCRLDWIDYFSFNPDFKDGPHTARVRVHRANRAEVDLLAWEKEFYEFMSKGVAPPPAENELAWPWPKYSLEGEKKMAKNSNNLGLSARDLHELLEKAKALGVINLTLAGGNSFTFGVPSEQSGSGMLPPAREARPICAECGVEKVRSKPPRKGFYCVECWKQNNGLA